MHADRLRNMMVDGYSSHLFPISKGSDDMDGVPWFQTDGTLLSIRNGERAVCMFLNQQVALAENKPIQFHCGNEDTIQVLNQSR